MIDLTLGELVNPERLRALWDSPDYDCQQCNKDGWAYDYIFNDYGICHCRLGHMHKTKLAINKVVLGPKIAL